MNRADVSFTSEGTRCAAWLYRPDGAEPSPCVVMAHGLGGIREARLDAFAERFADAGLAALVFDYRHFGSSEGEPRHLLDIKGQQADWRAALAYARELEGIDADRVALWGTSFSGGHVFEVAAEDARLAAAVVQVPFADGAATLRVLGPRNVAQLTVAGLRDELHRLRGREPYKIGLVGPPGSLAVMTTPDAEPGFKRLLPEGAPWTNEVAARIGLRVPLYRPGRRAASIRCPLLVCVAEHDALTPAAAALRAAERAPRAEVRRYPCGHFDIYVEEFFERAVADQVEFLRRHLLDETRAPRPSPPPRRRARARRAPAES